MASDPTAERQLALVTGSTGYIGGRLIPALLEAGFVVRALERHPDRLHDRPWRDRVDVAYYFIHALGTGTRFGDRDRATAQTFARVAADTDKSGRSVFRQRALFHPRGLPGQLY